ncbi:MAG: DUF1684 domain-containing protein [Anaerolineales bacterium]
MFDLEQYRMEKDEFFRHDPHSPLTPEQKETFSGLRYFPENPELLLRIHVDEFAEKEILSMQTTTGDVQEYERFGSFTFEVEGQQVKLTLFQSPHGYFLPFVDSLAGIETYGAGRYLEPQLLHDGRFLIDFNMAYNPFCAYNALYSCPITPFENRLKVPIRAGERVFEEHE